jgi:type IV pilus assembly protein PilB
MSSHTKKTLDTALIALLERAEILSATTLKTLLTQAGTDGKKFERSLVSEGHMTDAQFGQLKAQAHRWRFVDLERVPIDPALLHLLPSTVLREQKVVPFARKDGVVNIAVPDPDAPFIEQLEKKFSEGVSVYYATETALEAALSRYEGGFQEECQKILSAHAATGKGSDDTSIIELTNAILKHGMQQRASDIHIEPRQEGAIVRQRIDGVLYQMLDIPKDVHGPLMTRIKMLSNLAIDEHATPQDGKLLFTEDGKKTDIRVSFVPITHGEKAVLRLLSTQTDSLTLESLGLSENDRLKVQEQMKKSWGMILSTGPTGSGKTTTLYGIVRPLNRPEINIATIEDPVEYDIGGVNQIQVNEKSGVTFATGLRSIVRQDPNIILVGEIRDAETADIAVNAAMTGHLVLSTMHTNNAATAIPRLIDMGIEPFLISSTVNVIVAQRLVRKICVRCRESDGTLADRKGTLPPEILHLHKGKEKTLRLYHGKGCELCHGTGFHGRTGIFEVLIVDDTVRSLIMNHANATAIEEAAIKHGMTTMLQDGFEKASQGITTLDEVLRVIRS